MFRASSAMLASRNSGSISAAIASMAVWCSGDSRFQASMLTVTIWEFICHWSWL